MKGGTRGMASKTKVAKQKLRAMLKSDARSRANAKYRAEKARLKLKRAAANS